MYQLAKSKPARIALGAARVLGSVVAIVAGIIIVVPAGALAMLAWALGGVIETLRPKRTGATGVRPE